MATITRYTVGTGTFWEVRYRTPQRTTSRKRGFKTKAAASAFASTVEVSKLDGSYVAPTLGRVTVGELAGEWLERKEVALKPSAYKSVETSWRVHVKPAWGDVRLVDIDLPRVESWITKMCKDSGATVVLRNYQTLCGILDDAVKQRRLPRNPAKGVDNLPRKQRKEHTYLTHEQVDSLASDAKHTVLVVLLAYCGLRWGEAIALRVRHLDLLRKRINVTENAVQVGMTIHVGTTKGHESRSVPVPSSVVELLAKQCEGKGRDDLVFPSESGGYMKRPTSPSWWTHAIARSGVPSLTIHDLRHTSASLAVSAGANVLAVSRMLGHKDPSVTLTIYADLFDDDLDAVAERLDSKRVQAVSTRVKKGL